MTAAPALTLVVLTEDGASGWRPVMLCVRAICDLLVANVDWSRVRVLPREDGGRQVLDAAGAHRWDGRKAIGYNLRIELARYIANQLLAREGEARFVFFHVDADCRWSDGGPEASTNFKSFHDLMVVAVQGQLRAALQKHGRESELGALMERLHLVMPCWEIESWLYQNAERAIALCRERPCAGAHVDRYRAWAADRTLLDDVNDPKGRRELHCLDDRDKGVLAEGFPAAEVRRAERSFAYVVEAAARDGALLHALIATGAAAT